ncbi:Xanthine dehydrogenase/oxidase, partial [Aduncisulcus paluster]
HEHYIKAIDKILADPTITAHTISGTLKTGAQEHFYLETHTALVVPHDSMGDVEVYTTTQNTTVTQQMCARVLGIDMCRVSVGVRRLGGAFGGKEAVFNYTCAAAVAAQKTGRPVFFALDRKDDTAYSGKKHPMNIYYTIGCDSKGKLTGIKVDVYGNGGYSLDLSRAVCERALLHIDNAYYFPHVYIRGTMCKTNLPTNTAFRGFGAPQTLLAVEEAMEKLSMEAGIDVVDFKRRNLYTEGQLTHYGMSVNGTSNLHESWDKLMHSAAVVSRRRAVAEFNATNRFIKRGIGVSPLKFGVAFSQTFLNQGMSLIHIYKDGTVLVSHGGIEMGQGVHTKIQQIVADELHVPLSFVHIKESKTDCVPNASPTSASTGSDINGMAAKHAAATLWQRILPYVKAEREKRSLNVDNPMFVPRDIGFESDHPEETDDECLGLASDFDSGSWRSAIVSAWFARVCLSCQSFYRIPISGYSFVSGKGIPFSYFSFGCAVCEVEIDTRTGQMSNVRTDIIFDAGKSLNPAIDIGQVEGAFVQGMGWITMEQMVQIEQPGKDGKGSVDTGKILSSGPGNYKIPGALDIPRDFRVSLLPHSLNPLAVNRSKGVGEPPLCLAVVVYCAVRDAVRSARQSHGTKGDFDLRVPTTMESIRLCCSDFVTDLYGLSDERSISK